MSKVCTVCGLEKTTVDFCRDIRKSDGLQSYCRSCQRPSNRNTVANKSKLLISAIEKTCSICKVTKHANEFSRSNGSKDLLLAWCKNCRSAYECNRTKNKRATDTVYKAHLDFRRLIKNFRTVGADDDEVDSHRLVSVETYNLWLDYQTKVKNVLGPTDIDHIYPDSKFDLNDSFERLIGTNIINLSPMNASDNRSKGAKIIPELILNQITLANNFLLDTDLSEDERLTFEFLIETYEIFASFKLSIILKELEILI